MKMVPVTVKKIKQCSYHHVDYDYYQLNTRSTAHIISKFHMASTSNRSML